jgi:hypothetical protein
MDRDQAHHILRCAALAQSFLEDMGRGVDQAVMGERLVDTLTDIWATLMAVHEDATGTAPPVRLLCANCGQRTVLPADERMFCLNPDCRLVASPDWLFESARMDT